MANRLKLQKELETILGSRNVYFNPPENLKLKYPCILYELSKIDSEYADNTSYITNKSYKITLVHTDPDTELVDELLKMRHTSFNTSYTSDNLNHFVFTRYY